MALYPLKLRPGGIIPPEINVGVTLRKKAAAVAVAAVVAATPTPTPAETRLPAGADMFADASEITYGEFRDRISEYTYTKDFTAEVDETLEVNGLSDPAVRTAWWKFFLPVDKTAWLTLDTQLSFSQTVLDVATHMTVYSLLGSAVMSNLSGRGRNSGYFDSMAAISHYGNGYYSRLDSIQIFGTESGEPDGTWFYIQVGDPTDSVPDIPQAIVLRMSLTETEAGHFPIDGHDPSD